MPAKGHVKTKLGEVFGALTVTDIYPKEVANGRHRYQARCLCTCGKVVSFCCKELRLRKRHCGCKRRENPKKLPINEAALRVAYSRYKVSANKRGISWELDQKDARKLFESECFYCGAPPREQPVPHREDTYPLNGIDRKNPAQAYTNDNCVTCCKDCNYIKGVLPFDEFRERITKIHHHFSG